MISALMIGITFFAMEHTMRGISGGPMNPTIALAQIFWQCMTFNYEPGFTWNHWTLDYGVMYMFGPILGSLMGGNLYNYIRRLEYRLPRMKTYTPQKTTKRRRDGFYSDDSSSNGSVSTVTTVRTS